MKGLITLYYVPMNQQYAYHPTCCCCGRQYTHQYPQHGNNHNWPPYNSRIKDQGGKPITININEAAKHNNTFRTAIWTGDHLQVTLMSIDVGGDVGLEVHSAVDQFLRIEQGQGVVQMGDAENQLDFERNVFDDDAIMVPAGKWHNLTNTGNVPLKLYSIYAPPEHPFGTVHITQADDVD